MSTPETPETEAPVTTPRNTSTKDTLKGLLFFGATFGAFIGGVVTALAAVSAMVALAL